MYPGKRRWRYVKHLALRIVPAVPPPYSVTNILPQNHRMHTHRDRETLITTQGHVEEEYLKAGVKQARRRFDIPKGIYGRDNNKPSERSLCHEFPYAKDEEPYYIWVDVYVRSEELEWHIQNYGPVDGNWVNEVLPSC
jgi:hypothetical protein